MADYVEALYSHHGGPAGAAPVARAAFVHDLMREHETALLQPLLDFLVEKNSVRLLGPRQASARAPTVAMVLADRGGDVAARLAPKGIMCSGGGFYGVRCLAAQGVDPDHGALRVSFVHYTHPDEIGRLIAALGTEL